eukprot:CAMPEP_0183709700 /NCGR_PEP_ID=MMETSP0737-20130205/5689_1 /TAXON_ID=385413 /ORGANISM="Thalassiosira miniscula, Strain CCMP1093" /LENGTH=275 /DNA_ID=CAMNT_0025937865 /DNA_START=28 /DNA_END=855 /DNA_ORIENTATION=-
MAPLATTAAGLVLTFIASAPTSSVDAFSPISTSHSRHHVSCTTSSWRSSPILFPTKMSEEENAGDDSASATADQPPAEEEAEEEPQLDPEVVALKESITSLESDLKAKKSQLSNLKEMAEKYSSTGYARQVAQVENNKRMRGANLSDNKSAARAGVMQSFLPVLEELDVVGAKYAANDFARTLDGGLRSEFNNALGELGVAEYAVESGAAMDLGRVVAVEEEYSEEFAKGTVIRALKTGLEISGNVVRPAEVVGSLGSESAAAEEEAAGEEGAAE